MVEGEERESWAFTLKKRGAFDEALKAYAQELTSSLKVESPFIAQLCFEEMFDTVLLKYLKEQCIFDNKEGLLRQIEQDLRKVLTPELGRQDENRFFLDNFEKCRRKLFPRGRAKARFRVDSRLLLTREREALFRT